VQQPVAATGGGTLLRVEVTPGASDDAFPDGFNQWRELLEARVKAPAQDGEANRALCALAARALDLDTNSVTVKSGHTSRRKTLFVRGLGPDEVNERLGGVIER